MSRRLLEGEGAVIVVIYMVQQINCIRNKEGDIIEVTFILRNIECCSSHYANVFDDYPKLSTLSESPVSTNDLCVYEELTLQIII